jgi:hypothetical protein
VESAFVIRDIYLRIVKNIVVPIIALIMGIVMNSSVFVMRDGKASIAVLKNARSNVWMMGIAIWMNVIVNLDIRESFVNSKSASMTVLIMEFVKTINASVLMVISEKIAPYMNAEIIVLNKVSVTAKQGNALVMMGFMETTVL